MSKVGKFISLEGADGAGKSTNVKVLKSFLESQGYKVLVTHEPNGKYRDIILNEKLTGLAEMFMFAANRAEHVAKLIKPHLEKGYIVISDRYVDSSYAYQGSGRDLEEETLIVNDWAMQGLMPDHTLFFDIPFEESIRRLEERNRRASDIANNRLDDETVEFKRKVFSGYEKCLKLYSHRMVRIDALPEEAEVAAKVIAWARIHFPAVE